MLSRYVIATFGYGFSRTMYYTHFMEKEYITKCHEKKRRPLLWSERIGYAIPNGIVTPFLLPAVILEDVRRIEHVIYGFEQPKDSPILFY